MVLLVIFILGALLLGTGALFSPALPTAQPRIALAGTLIFALIIGGAVFWAYLFGWDTLVIDYMLFALVVGVLLRGTLSGGQSRAEGRGEVLHDRDQGWTGPEDLLFFLAIAALVVISVLLRGDQFAQDSLLVMNASQVQQTGDLVTIAPESNDSFLSPSRIPPGFSAISVYLSQQLNLGLPAVQTGIGAVITFLLVWLVYDFGAELRDKALGRAMAAAILLGTGVVNAYFNRQFDTLVGLLFAFAFMIFAERYRREGKWQDMVAGGLMLGATMLLHHATFLLLATSYGVWIIFIMLFSRKQLSLTHALGLLLGIGGICAIATAPYWLAPLQPVTQFGMIISLDMWFSFLVSVLSFHGVLALVVSIIGIVTIAAVQRAAVQRSTPSPQLGLFGWLLLLLALALYIGVAAYPPTSQAPLLLIPLTLLGGFGLDWLWTTLIAQRFVALPMMNRRFVGVGMVVFGLLIVVMNTVLFVG